MLEITNDTQPMNDKDFKESMDGLPEEIRRFNLARITASRMTPLQTLIRATAILAGSESQRIAAESADEKPDGQAENA